MNTSEPDLSQFPGFDADLLAKLANDLFKALPGAVFPSGASSLVTPTAVSGAPSPDFALPPASPVGRSPKGFAAPSIPAAPSFYFNERLNPVRPQAEFPVEPRPFSASSALPDFALPKEPNSSSSIPASPAIGRSPEGFVPPSIPTAPTFYFTEHANPVGPVLHVTEQKLTDSRSETPIPATSAAGLLDVHLLRRDFPILEERVNGKRLIWLDNAATTQKPRQVVERLRHFYERENSNIHRAAHELAARATDAYEGAREKVRGFLNARTANEVIFVRGATEAINLIAQSWGREHIGKGDEIIITWLEHHANIVPWQQLAEEKDARLKVVPVDDSGQVILAEYQKLLGPKTKLVSLTQVSNALGTVTPAALMVRMAQGFGARVLVDGAQAVSHMRVDVQQLDCDWYVFSGHKVFAPTGIGVLYGKEDLLASMAPWQGGGNMIKDVTFEHTEYQPGPPGRFEAGTGNIADAVGLGAAIDYVTQIGMENISGYEHQLLEYMIRQLKNIPGLRIIGTAAEQAGVLSFVLDGFKTEEVGQALNREGIAVRSGHHCAQPILRRFGVETAVRPSLAFYNTFEDIDALAAALTRIRSSRNTVVIPQ
jgi:cysteine desulfurase / selenocysteine lyase